MKGEIVNQVAAEHGDPGACYGPVLLRDRCTHGQGNLEPIQFKIITDRPRYLLTCYPWFRLFAVQQNIPNFFTHSLSVSWISAVYLNKFGFKMLKIILFFFHTVLPGQTRFEYLYRRTNLPRITRESNMLYINNDFTTISYFYQCFVNT